MLRATLALYVRPVISHSVRTQRGGNYRRMQAGFRRQNRVMQDAQAFEEYPEAEFDANFLEVGKSHVEHEKELELRKEQRKFYTIRHKYFKSPKMPNMLTMAEKEHIRNLHRENPEEWTAERLTESFPATKDIIVKIIKANWQPQNMEAVERHDSRVKHNWDLFKQNKLDNVTPELRECLNRFSNRSFDAKQNAYVKARVDQIEFQFPKPKNQEFSSIVGTLEAAKKQLNHQSLSHSEQKKQLRGKADGPKMLANEREVEQASQIILKKKDRNRSMTFDQLTHQSPKQDENQRTHFSIDLKKSNKPKTVEVVEESIEKNVNTQLSVHTEESYSLTSSQPQAKQFEPIQKYNTTVSTPPAVNPTDLANFVKRPDRIRIPKHLWKRGQIYQRDDSFYHYTGGFLYRVPGLSA